MEDVRVLGEATGPPPIRRSWHSWRKLLKGIPLGEGREVELPGDIEEDEELGKFLRRLGVEANKIGISLRKRVLRRKGRRPTLEVWVVGKVGPRSGKMEEKG